jgi:transposase
MRKTSFEQFSFSKSLLDMANPYSIEPRWRIVWIDLTLNHSVAEISALFCVSERTVWRYIALFRQTGDVEPQHREYGPRRMLGELEQLTLLHLILENHGIYLHEIQTKLGRICLELV